LKIYQATKLVRRFYISYVLAIHKFLCKISLGHKNTRFRLTKLDILIVLKVLNHGYMLISTLVKVKLNGQVLETGCPRLEPALMKY